MGIDGDNGAAAVGAGAGEVCEAAEGEAAALEERVVTCVGTSRFKAAAGEAAALSEILSPVALGITIFGAGAGAGTTAGTVAVLLRTGDGARCKS